MTQYLIELDVANRALQIIGVPMIHSVGEATRARRETMFAIDKLRRSELQRAVWTFATRRAILRPIITTTKLVTFPLFALDTTYAAANVAQDENGFLWVSTGDSNLGNSPGAANAVSPWTPYFGPIVAQVWDDAAAWLPGDVVYVSSTAYIGILPSTDKDPTTETAYWRELPDATVSALLAFSPDGYAPDAATTRTRYRLPANFLRLAPQDPKAPNQDHRNVTAAMRFNDWEIEGLYIYSTENTGPVVLRFVADVTQVSQMHSLFCDVWAARLAEVVADPLTFSARMAAKATNEYARCFRRASLLNAVEGGTTELEAGDAPPPQPQGQGQ